MSHDPTEIPTSSERVSSVEVDGLPGRGSSSTTEYHFYIIGNIAYNLRKLA